MVSHKDVAEAWVQRQKLTGSRMYTQHGVIYSYGPHFPIAQFIDVNNVLFNEDKYSSSTSKHQSIVRRVIPHNCKLIECDTNTIKKAVNYPESPIVIEKKIQPEDLYDLMQTIETFFKSKGIKRFPKKQIQEYFTMKFVAKMI